MVQVMNIFWSFLNVRKINDKSWLLYGHKNEQNDTINMDNLTVTSPNEVFDGTPYFAVFCRAISWRMLIVSWSTPPNPNFNMTTELLSSRFVSYGLEYCSFLIGGCSVCEKQYNFTHLFIRIFRCCLLQKLKSLFKSQPVIGFSYKRRRCLG